MWQSLGLRSPPPCRFSLVLPIRASHRTSPDPGEGNARLLMGREESHVARRHRDGKDRSQHSITGSHRCPAPRSRPNPGVLAAHHPPIPCVEPWSSGSERRARCCPPHAWFSWEGGKKNEKERGRTPTPAGFPEGLLGLPQNVHA